MPTSRWRVPPKYLLRRSDGRWTSFDGWVADAVGRAPRGCRRDNLANAVGLLPAELDVITDRLVASGRIERNMRSAGGTAGYPLRFAPRRCLLGDQGVAHHKQSCGARLER